MPLCLLHNERFPGWSIQSPRRTVDAAASCTALISPPSSTGLSGSRRGPRSRSFLDRLLEILSAAQSALKALDAQKPNEKPTGEPEEIRLPHWRCSSCGYRKFFTKPVNARTAGGCPSAAENTLSQRNGRHTASVIDTSNPSLRRRPDQLRGTRIFFKNVPARNLPADLPSLARQNAAAQFSRHPVFLDDAQTVRMSRLPTRTHARRRAISLPTSHS
jgi:hypothetical protein